MEPGGHDIQKIESGRTRPAYIPMPKGRGFTTHFGNDWSESLFFP